MGSLQKSIPGKVIHNWQLVVELLRYSWKQVNGNGVDIEIGTDSELNNSISQQSNRKSQLDLGHKYNLDLHSKNTSG